VRNLINYAKYLVGPLGLTSLMGCKALQIPETPPSPTTDAKISSPKLSSGRDPVHSKVVLHPQLPVSATTLSKPAKATQARLSEAYGRLPLRFEANQGQTDAQVKFLSRGRGYTLFLTPTEAVLVLKRGSGAKDKRPEQTHHETPGPANPQPTTVLHMHLIGANPVPQVSGLDELPGKSNYFMGNDPKKWRTNVRHYAKVKYEQIYPGIDLVFYGNQRQLEYDFVVSPGADFGIIKLAFEGANKIEIDDTGDLVLHTHIGPIHLRKPLIYQEMNGAKLDVFGGYVLNRESKIANPKSKTVGFQVAAYDSSKPLIIDPVLIYSTYLGGADFDQGKGIAVDAFGNTYVTGFTKSTDFPVADAPPQAFNAGSLDVFVTKINAAGSALVYSTYFGGNRDDEGKSIAVDANGSAYVTGRTISDDFPVAGTPTQAFKAGNNDAFVAKLNPNGSALVYSTYLGGFRTDKGNGIAVDADGNAYLTGSTESSDFPTANPFQPNLGEGGGILSGDAFVTKLNPDERRLFTPLFSAVHVGTRAMISHSTLQGVPM